MKKSFTAAWIAIALGMSVGAYAQNTALRVGASKVDVTPAHAELTASRTQIPSANTTSAAPLTNCCVCSVLDASQCNSGTYNSPINLLLSPRHVRPQKPRRAFRPDRRLRAVLRQQPDLARPHRRAVDCSAALQADPKLALLGLRAVLPTGLQPHRFGDEVLRPHQQVPPVAKDHGPRRAGMHPQIGNRHCFLDVNFARPAVIPQSIRDVGMLLDLT